jgi:nucleoid DNA-binding protein
MRISDFIEKYACAYNLSKAEAKRQIDNVFLFLEEALDEFEDKEKMMLPFGFIQRKDKAPRNYRNPRTGELIEKPAQKNFIFNLRSYNAKINKY